MFFDEERILSVREMILSKTLEDRAKALKKLLPHQKDLWKYLRLCMVYLLQWDYLILLYMNFCQDQKKKSWDFKNGWNWFRWFKSRIDELHEQNPMLGHRGCRLGISFRNREMQCRAIFEAHQN